MDDSRQRLRRLAQILVFAESDMRQASAAARHLDEFGSAMHGNAERALWAGMIVCYARPFLQSNGLGVVPEKLASPSHQASRSLHLRLKEVRDQLVAHNDVTPDREALDAAETLGFGNGLTEGWRPFNDEVLPAIEQLADAQERNFRERRHEIERDILEG